MPEDTGKIPSTSRYNPFKLDSNASYLLAGGLGGIGRSLAAWMVEQGARHLTFLSRSGGSPENDLFFAELKSMNCSVTIAAGLVDNMGDLRKAIASSPKPIKGVIHLAMALRVSLL